MLAKNIMENRKKVKEMVDLVSGQAITKNKENFLKSKFPKFGE